MFVQLLRDFLGKPAGERLDVTETDAKALIAQQIATPVTEDPITPAVQKATPTLEPVWCAENYVRRRHSFGSLNEWSVH
jgi:hypothetical protein